MEDTFQYDLIPSGSRVLCALSGGADSMYLLCRLLESARRRGYAVCAAHYNHRIRPAASEDAEFVRDWCRHREIPLILGSCDVPAQAGRFPLSLAPAMCPPKPPARALDWRKPPDKCATLF